MSIITNPDQLIQDTHVTFNTTARTIEVDLSEVLTDGTSADGVTLKAIYSFCKDAWKTDGDLIRLPFPFTPITDEQFEIKEGWDFLNDATRNLIRTGGWAVKDLAGNTTEEWAGIVTLGALVDGTQVYFTQSDGATTDIEEAGPVNQAIKIYDTVTDNRGSLTLFARERANKYASSTLSDIGVAGDMTYQVYRFPLATSADLNITESDATLDEDGSDTLGITITYQESTANDVVQTINGTDYDFRVVVDGNGLSIQDIYQTLQFRLRSETDINSVVITGEPRIGETESELAYFVGPDLILNRGVLLINFALSDTNNIKHNPVGFDDITFPYAAAITINFNNNLINDASAEYRVFFTTAGNGSDYGTTNAITVEDNDEAEMAGSVSAANADGSIVLSYDYTNNDQRGVTNTPAGITVVALGLSTGQYVSATGTIERSTSNVVSLVSSLERNYSAGTVAN